MEPRLQEACHLLTSLRSRRARKPCVPGWRLAAVSLEAAARCRVFIVPRPQLCTGFSHTLAAQLFAVRAQALVFALVPCLGSARRRCPHTRFSLSLLCLRSSLFGSDRACCQPRLLLEVGLQLFPGHRCTALRCKRCCVARLLAVARLPESRCCHLACFFFLLACRVASFARPQEQVLLHAHPAIRRRLLYMPFHSLHRHAHHRIKAWRSVPSIMSSPTPPDWGQETFHDAAPIHVPSSPPSANAPGDVTPGFEAPALAACPVCLERPSPEPDVHDTTYPCCGAFTHIGCMLQAARLHGRCPNCRAAIDHLPREPNIATRCQDLGISLDLVAPPSHQTAHTVVRDYAARTFSSADEAEPPEPERVRAVCCRRLSGPATGFMELPDARMHWAPVPHRNDRGIASWTPQWLCMRCQNMLPTAFVQPPGPPRVVTIA